MPLFKVAAAADIPPGRHRVVSVGVEDAVVCNVEGAWYAVDHVCPHRGGSLGDGDLDGAILVCPLHAWRFDVRTGACTHAPQVAVRTYPVRIVEGRVEIDTGSAQALADDTPPDLT